VRVVLYYSHFTVQKSDSVANESSVSSFILSHFGELAGSGGGSIGCVIVDVYSGFPL
jgi:hypothetical protein